MLERRFSGGGFSEPFFLEFTGRREINASGEFLL